MSPSLVAGLLLAAILINMKSVECSIKTSDAGTSKSQKIMSVHQRLDESIWKDVNDETKFLNASYPGTNHCTLSEDFEIGTDPTSVETDQCCEDHYDCEYFLTPKNTLYGLTSKALYTISGCDCDQKFLECLVRVATSDTIESHDKYAAKEYGKFFFNIVNPDCLLFDHPLVCTERGRSNNCTKYEKDTEQHKFWQFAAGKNFPLS